MSPSPSGIGITCPPTKVPCPFLHETGSRAHALVGPFDAMAGDGLAHLLSRREHEGHGRRHGTRRSDAARRAPDADRDTPVRSGARERGRYAIDGELGRGGMGVVLRAFDTELKRHVAMKVVSEDLSSND